MELIVDRRECLENHSENQHNGAVELSSVVNTSYCLHSRVTEGPDTYVFDTVLNRASNPTLATSLSTNTIELYSVDKLKKILSLTGHTKPITGIKFSNEQPCHLYSSSLDGRICLWDIRQNSENPVQSFMDDTDEVLKPLASFDFSIDENFLCAGTEIIREDAFLIFWDCRTTKILGGYWDSHTDDITQVKFHYDKPESMVSASVDGLINLFDLKEKSEEDALLQTFNTGSSVSKLMWIPKQPRDMLSCITHIEELQMWSIDEASPSSLFDKDNMKKNFQVNVALHYMIDTFLREGSVHLVTGTNSGVVHIWTVNGNELSLWTQLEGGHKGIVRTVSWNSEEDIIITGGEDGAVCYWKPGSQHLKSVSSSESWNKKAVSYMKNQVTAHPTKPY